MSSCLYCGPLPASRFPAFVSPMVCNCQRQLASVAEVPFRMSPLCRMSPAANSAGECSGLLLPQRADSQGIISKLASQSGRAGRVVAIQRWIPSRNPSGDATIVMVATRWPWQRSGLGSRSRQRRPRRAQLRRPQTARTWRCRRPSVRSLIASAFRSLRSARRASARVASYGLRRKTWP